MTPTRPFRLLGIALLLLLQYGCGGLEPGGANSRTGEMAGEPAGETLHPTTGETYGEAVGETIGEAVGETIGEAGGEIGKATVDGLLETGRRRLEMLPPGTVVNDGPPRGWTHLILKSMPRPAAGDLARVDASDLEVASLFSTVIVASVQSRTAAGTAASYRLHQLAGGVSTKVGGEHTIVTPDSWRRLKANLNLITAQVLKEIHRQQSSVRVVLRSDALAVLDTPVVVRKGERNVPMALRYAIVVDPQTGRLETLGWLLEADSQGQFTGLASQLHWLPQNNVADCPLYVDSREYFWGIPSRKAYACIDIPRGRAQQEMPSRLQTVVCLTQFGVEDAKQLDQGLRTALLQWENRHSGQAIMQGGGG